MKKFPIYLNLILKFKQSLYYYLVFLFFLINALLAIFFSFGLPGNIRMFTNQSYSMLPNINPSSLTIVKQFPEYNPGEIITFYREVNGHEEIITHRIWRLGGNVYLTKGDNNQAVDSEIVEPRLIIGKVIMLIPYLGFWITYIKSQPGTYLLIILPMLIIILTELSNIYKLLKK